MRLQKYMALCGVASRRKAEEWIASGRVRVNGEIVREMGVQVNPETDAVLLDGKPIMPEETKVTLLFYKPYGVVSTLKDPQGRRCVGDFFRDYPYRLYPVGRLDYDTQGALLLTNDGDLAQRMTHPSFETPKRYRAVIFGDIAQPALEALRAGVEIDGRRTAPAKARVVGQSATDTIVHITIHEGRNRQVRKMLGAVGHTIHHLSREAIGPLELGTLEPGQYREVSQAELEALLRAGTGRK